MARDQLFSGNCKPLFCQSSYGSNQPLVCLGRLFDHCIDRSSHPIDRSSHPFASRISEGMKLDTLDRFLYTSQ